MPETITPTKTVTVPAETIDNALVALLAAERYFETQAQGEAPWGLFGETFCELYHAAHGSFDNPNDPGGDGFSDHYNALEERGIEEARKGWATTWADAAKYVGGTIRFIPEWPDARG